MERIVAALRREPVRAYLYTVITAVVALISGHGIVSEDHASLWFAAATAVLGLGGTEAARRRVTPAQQ